MKLLVGCVNLNTKPLTEVFLQTLEKASLNFINTTIGLMDNRLDIVIIDNGSKEKLDDLYHFKWNNYHLIRNENNKGVSAAWNQIIKFGFNDKAEPLYDYYLICNNDIYWTEHSLGNFFNSIKLFKHNNISEYGWISFMQNDYKEDSVKIPEIKQLERYYWNYRPHADNVKSKEQMLDLVELSYSSFGGIEQFAAKLDDDFGPHIHELHPKATCFALSKECIQKVGLFDEWNCPTGLHEDCDYHIRMKQAGLKAGTCYNAYIHHFSCMTRTRSDITTGDSWVNAREKAFQEKWGFSSKNIPDTKDIDKYFKLRVDVGSGYGPRKDKHFYHLEIDKKFDDIEYLHDCSKSLPFGDNTIDKIYCSNCLEHQSWHDIHNILTNWYNCMKSNSHIEIRVPNFEFAVGRYIDKSWGLRFDNGELNLMHLILGGDNEGIQHIHKSLFDYKNLYALMNNVGFTNIRNISEFGSWELKLVGEKL